MNSLKAPVSYTERSLSNGCSVSGHRCRRWSTVSCSESTHCSLLCMKLAESDVVALSTAQALLLDPWDLTENHLAQAMGEIFTHRVDYADLYFQYSRSESWALEE